MEPHQSAVLQEVIHKLQGLLGGSNDSSGPQEASIPEFDAHYAKFVDFAGSQSPEIQQLTDVFSQACKYMRQILGYSAACKKYSADQEKKLQDKFRALFQKCEEIDKNHRDYADHAHAIRDLLSAPYWVFAPTPQFMIKGAIESADFNPIRFMKKKVQSHIDWWKLLQNATRALQEYVKKNYPTGISFFGKEDHWNNIISGSGGSSAPVQKPKPAPVHHKEEKKEAAPVQKPPKKQLVGLSYEITNFHGENVQIQENELQMKHGVYIEKCSKAIFKVHPKVKSVVLNKCEHLVLVAWNCVSGIELMNCQDVKVYIKEKSPSVSIDKSMDTKVVLNEAHMGTEIVSSKSSQLTVCSQNATGNESKAYTVGEQIITKWDPNSKSFKTGIYDAFL